jgi:hypothetical protein
MWLFILFQEFEFPYQSVSNIIHQYQQNHFHIEAKKGREGRKEEKL